MTRYNDKPSSLKTDDIVQLKPVYENVINMLLNGAYLRALLVDRRGHVSDDGWRFCLRIYGISIWGYPHEEKKEEREQRDNRDDEKYRFGECGDRLDEQNAEQYRSENLIPAPEFNQHLKTILWERRTRWSRSRSSSQIIAPPPTPLRPDACKVPATDCGPWANSP